MEEQNKNENPENINNIVEININKEDENSKYEIYKETIEINQVEMNNKDENIKNIKTNEEIIINNENNEIKVEIKENKNEENINNNIIINKEEKNEENIRIDNNENNNKNDINKINCLDNEDNKEKNDINSKLDMIIKELKDKDSLIKSLQNDIVNLKKENESISAEFTSKIKEVKQNQENELNQIKQNYEKKISELKEEMATKADIKYFAKRRDIDYFKDIIESLTTKINDLEKVFDNKIGFMESNMTHIFEMEEELKKKDGEKKVINNHMNNDNNNIINKSINNNNININLNNNKINVKNENINKKDLKKQYDPKFYKELEQVFNEIFSSKNISNQSINKKLIERLQSAAKKLLDKKLFPLDFAKDYMNDIKLKLSNQLDNIEHLKIEVFKALSSINDELLEKINLNFMKKELKNVDVQNFNIISFRKSLELSQEEYSDEALKKLYVDMRGNLDSMAIYILSKRK